MVSKGKKASRNRPGANATSVRGSIANLNVPNGFGKNKGAGKVIFAGNIGKSKGKKSDHCIRCDATDHNWRNCPLPFQPIPAFYKRVEQDRGTGKSSKPVLVMDTLADQPAETYPTTANDVSQSQTILDQPVQLPPDAFLDEYTMDGEAEWDFWDNAEWAWVTEAICYAPSPMKDERFSRTAILDTGSSTSVTSSSWVKLWDSAFEENCHSSIRRFDLDPGHRCRAWVRIC